MDVGSSGWFVRSCRLETHGHAGKSPSVFFFGVLRGGCFFYFFISVGVVRVSVEREVEWVRQHVDADRESVLRGVWRNAHRYRRSALNISCAFDVWLSSLARDSSPPVSGVKRTDGRCRCRYQEAMSNPKSGKYATHLAVLITAPAYRSKQGRKVHHRSSETAAVDSVRVGAVVDCRVHSTQEMALCTGWPLVWRRRRRRRRIQLVADDGSRPLRAPQCVDIAIQNRTCPHRTAKDRPRGRSEWAHAAGQQVNGSPTTLPGYDLPPSAFRHEGGRKNESLSDSEREHIHRYTRLPRGADTHLKDRSHSITLSAGRTGGPISSTRLDNQDGGRCSHAPEQSATPLARFLDRRPSLIVCKRRYIDIHHRPEALLCRNLTTLRRGEWS